MKNVEHTILGSFESEKDMQLAYGRLQAEKVGTVHLKKNTLLTGGHKIGCIPHNKAHQTKYNNFRELALLIFATFITATLCGVYALFSFWDPQKTLLTFFLIAIFSVGGGFLGFTQCNNILRQSKKRLSQKQKQDGLVVEVNTEKELIQTKKILSNSNAINIKVF